jgi:hypothetical protein
MNKGMLAVAVAALALGNHAAMPEDQAGSFSSNDEFGEFMQGFWEAPRPDRVESALRYAVESGIWKRESSMAPTFAGFSCMFHRYPERKEAWSKAVASLEQEPREFFQRAMELEPPTFIEEAPVSPKRNDMNWGCYFVTADLRYARDVINTMAHLDERKDLQQFLAATSAQWSLAGIARDNEAVRRELQETARGPNAELAAAAKTALESPLEDIRAYVSEVLRQQRAAGVW